MILHIISQSPQQSDAFQSCLRNAGAEDAILLIEDAVHALFYYSRLCQQQEKLSQLKVYGLSEDALARGAPALELDTVTLIDYDGFVALTEQYPSSMSWY